jgi:hypothetical protein
MSWIELCRWARGAPVVVVGLGVSYAIADLLAARLRRDGVVAWAQPDEGGASWPESARVLRVSRSGRAWSGVPAHALVTERPDLDVPSWTVPTTGKSGPIADVHFAASVCRELAPATEPLVRLPDSAIVALDGPVGPIRSLLGACALKGIELPLDVTSIDDLGHGPHVRLLRRREAPLVLVSHDRGLGEAVAHWCRETGHPFLLCSPTTSCATTEVFQVVAGRLASARSAGPAWAPSVVEDSLRHRVRAVREREVTS